MNGSCLAVTDDPGRRCRRHDRHGASTDRYPYGTTPQQEPGNRLRWFTVRLTMQKPAGDVTVRYVVFGNSPLYVYREQDYKKTSGTM